jgi:hypothetical protein
MKLEAEGPEISNWVQKDILDAGVPLCSLEGFSVKEERVTALFERRRSTKRPSTWGALGIASFLMKNENVNDWKSKCKLAEVLRVPLYLVVWRAPDDTFPIYAIKYSDSSLTASLVTDLTNCEELAKWLGSFKGIPVSKRFLEPGRLSVIDECLRKHRMPWPGNLDGFIMRASNLPSVLIEFARTEQKPVRKHNLNDYFPQDIHRWKPFEIARRCLNVPFLILTWSSNEKIVKSQELIEFDESASPHLRMGNEEILSSAQVIKKLERFC